MPRIAGSGPFRERICARIVDKQIECAVLAWVAERRPSMVKSFFGICFFWVLLYIQVAIEEWE